MKKFLAIPLVALLATLLSSGVYAADRKQDKNSAEVTYVTSIDCQNCVKKMEAQLPFVAGVKDMKISLDEKTVWVKYDTRKTNPDKIAAAINKMGYEAQVIPAEKSDK